MSSDIGLTLWRIAERALGSIKSKELCGPWLIDLPEKPGLRGGEYAVATDGSSMLWTLDWQPTLIRAITEDYKEVREKLMLHVAPSPESTPIWRGSLVELKNFSGEPVWSLPCPECKGLSVNSNYVSCSFCEGDGTMTPDSRPGRFCGAPIDLDRLACLLESLPSDSIVRVHTEGDKFWVLHETFRAVLCCMHVPEQQDFCGMFDKWQAAPSFPEMLPTVR